MLKTISAALLAVSVIAAPAFAAGSSNSTADAPATKTTQASTQAKTSGPNANAKVAKNHRKHISYRRHHGKTAALKTNGKTLKTSAKISMKPAVTAAKRG
jgi:creatinine amidohydrolase/Fe(II)-dependent formamide hydrolase-like protein